MAYYLGIDLGTTGLKSIILTPDGRTLGSGYQEYPVETPVQYFAQQDPGKWWDALCSTVRQALSASGVNAEEVAGIGLSGQMHGAVFLDNSYKLLCPAIIWCDQRSTSELEYMHSVISSNELIEWIQNPLATGFQICSLLWLKNNKPDIYKKTRHVLLPKDYLRFLLTGTIATEPSDACSTALYNCIEYRWSGEILQRLALDSSVFPVADHFSYEIGGTLTGKAAEALGLTEDTIVAFGGGDQPMQALGNGVLNIGDALITLGTGGQVFVPTCTPEADPLLRSHLFCHAEKNTWYKLGAILNCCLAQNWFFEKILENGDYAELHKKAAEVPAGSDGLLFLPYLTGERTPHMNPNAKGVFWGLTLRHDKAVMARSVVEGISYALYETGLSLNINWEQIERVIITGGGSHSTLWKQIIADLFNRPIYTTNTKEAACYGAAICAMVANGEYSSLSEACANIVKLDPAPIMPNTENNGIYRERFELFRKVYLANKTLFNEGTI